MEYQHFIPQLLLRNYAHPFECPHAQGEKKKCRKHKHEKMKFPGDMVVRNLNLTESPYSLEESPVKRICGQPDMYQDRGRSTAKEQRRIETMFSTMESQASTIIRRITKSFENGDTALWLTRIDKDLLRRFLFLLKYRGSTFYQRFYHDDAESYSEDDKELLRDYMRERSFERPLDVWFHNLETIMTLDMDPEGKWENHVRENMFFMDAEWFIMTMQKMYLTICTPSHLNDEFILTENSYNVFEGFNSFVQNDKTGKCEGGNWLNLHEFAPLSPKLMFVMRSYLLPNPKEDSNPRVREGRESHRQVIIDDVWGSDAKSILQDLPVQKAENSYIQEVRGQLSHRPGEDGTPRKNHKFCFHFFPINTGHVQKINGIMLDNAQRTSRIIYGNQKTFISTLEWFISEPCRVGKMITGVDADLRLGYLKKLESFLKSMGSVRELCWIEKPTPIEEDYEELMYEREELFRLMQRNCRNSGPGEHDSDSSDLETYSRFAGSMFTLPKDVTQASRMMRLRIKIDSWSFGIEESIRIRNRKLLTASYLDLPCSRVWLYLKLIRSMHLGDGDVSQNVIDEAFSSCPEDLFSELKYLMKPGKLNRLMFATVENHLWLQRNPTAPELLFFDLAPENSVGALQGKLKNCGITEVEQLARDYEHAMPRELRPMEMLLDELGLQIAAKREFLTRLVVKTELKGMMQGNRGIFSEDLLDVFFKFTYPISDF